MVLKLQAFTGVLLAMLVGTALQLAQPRLWPWQGYAALGVLGLFGDHRAPSAMRRVSQSGSGCGTEASNSAV